MNKLALRNDPLAHPRPDISSLPEDLRRDVEANFGFLEATIAESTKSAYRKAWERFCAWAKKRGLPFMPTTPEVVATYASHLATDPPPGDGLSDKKAKKKKFSTIGVAISAIGSTHDAAGIDPNPIKSTHVRKTLLGIGRTIGKEQKQKRDLSVAELHRMLAQIPPQGLLGVRDRALLLLWFACASRRSEPCALDLEDLDFREEGLYATFRKTKTDQSRKGLTKGVPYSSAADHCPVRCIRAWIQCLEQHGFREGPLFRAVNRGWIEEEALTPAAAVLRIKRYAKLAGIDPADVSGHSMRSGFATSASRKGKTVDAIMQQTGHRSVQTVLKYIRRGKLITESAAVGVLDG